MDWFRHGLTEFIIGVAVCNSAADSTKPARILTCESIAQILQAIGEPTFVIAYRKVNRREYRAAAIPAPPLFT